MKRTKEPAEKRKHKIRDSASIAHAVGFNAIQAIKKRQESTEWLRDAAGFNHGLKLSPDEQPIAAQLFRDLIKGENVKKHKQKKIDFEILLANLLYRNWRRPVAISLDPKHWVQKKNQVRYRYRRATYFTAEKGIYMLERHNLIKIRKGYGHEDGSKAHRTKIWPTDKLLDYFPKIPDAVIFDPVELVELRDEDEKGKLKEYTDTAETRRIRKVLERVNRVNQSAKIEHGNHRLHASLIAIFIKKFTLYGRLHTRGYMHLQGFSEDERGEILINGDPVVELDFVGLHPHLLYAKEGLQCVDDPYSIVNGDPKARNFIKQILLYMLNAVNEVKAESAANNWLHENHAERADLEEIGITRARPTMEDLKRVHAPIAHLFCIGKETSLRTMNKESRIALDIVNYFAEQRKPILCVHDSFLVQEQHEEELKTTMERVFTKHAWGFKCPVK